MHKVLEYTPSITQSHCDTRTREVEAGGSGLPQLRREFKASLLHEVAYKFVLIIVQENTLSNIQKRMGMCKGCGLLLSENDPFMG